ncbi:MAG: M55 family metallopeptidase [Candidatus Latescibacterota bacterium]
MKFVVAVDCEGVACAVGTQGGTLTDSPNFAFARRQATREGNAAVRGLFAAGATRVIVWDNHGGSLNLDYDELDERCDIALGTGFAHRFPGLDDTFAGVVLIGYHAMDNTVDGVMAHSFSSAAYQYMKVNGREVGEIEIDAAIAGERGVPVIFLASDDKAVSEARSFLPGIETVTTKEGYAWNAAISLHPRRAAAQIYDGVQRAVGRLGQLTPFRFSAPLIYEVRYKRLDAAQAASRGYQGGERLDPYTVRWQFARLSDRF